MMEKQWMGILKNTFAEKFRALQNQFTNIHLFFLKASVAPFESYLIPTATISGLLNSFSKNISTTYHNL